METKRVWCMQVLFAAMLAVIQVRPTDSQAFPVGHVSAAMALQVHPDGSEDGPHHERHYDRGFEGTYSGLPDGYRWRNDHPIDTDAGLQFRRLSGLGATTRPHSTVTSTSEVEALIAFKQGVASDSLGALSSWTSNDSDACHWKGVTCTRTSKTVVALQLGGLQLVGSISPLLGRLIYLQNLDLSGNSFSGKIPTSLLNCSHLSSLVLNNNNLSGQIPSQLGNLQNLRSVSLGNNLLLAGLLPASVGNCSLLRRIDLDYTSVVGEIPSTLGQLAHLESLNLTNTFNSGTIPKSLGNCSFLTYLAMGNVYDQSVSSNVGNNLENELSGHLPAELGQLQRLQGLAIGGTIIGGAFPAWIANLTALTGLGLELSSFSGEIPELLGKLPLEVLGLAYNKFSGPIPADISNCTNLWFLDLSGNPSFSGVIPAHLGNLRKLGLLGLENNNFSGLIPSSLSNCSALRVLTLEGNQFFDPQPVPPWTVSLVNLTELHLADMNLLGEIPVALGELSKLTALRLWGNQLSGVIPASLGNCTALEDLELSNNRLSGEMPPAIWMFRQLQSLQVSSNLLMGTLPASIGNLSNLQVLECDRNLFSGGIPSQLGSLQSLQIANLDENNLLGSISQSLGNCSALTSLTISQNQLSGLIPASMGNLSELEGLFLSANHLEGEIPVGLMRCKGLGSLDLSENLLVGNVPQEIGQLVSLQSLYLHHNNLSGTLPHTLGFCRTLLYVDISYNKFYGVVPGAAIANLSAGLNSLNVSNNLLSGTLPQELGKLSLVYYLDFSVNNFSGPIPSGLGGCRSLQRLDLSINKFSGSIPPTVGQLGYLAFINVSYNNLEGPIPDGGVLNSTNLTAASFLGNPGLCGSIISKACPASRTPTASSSACKAFGCGSIVIVIAGTASGGGIALIALGVFIFYWFCYNRRSSERACAVLTFAYGLKLSEEDLRMIIERPENVIGVGGRSTVYKGVLSAGRTIAVKVLTRPSFDDVDDCKPAAETDLYREALTLSKLRHRNILKVLGLFSFQDKKIHALILEYMPKASLHNQLYDVEDCELSWETRLNIAMGVAQGMVYLHSQAHEPVIHRDLKPSNIFLDADLEPKLGDFGISRLGNPDCSDGQTTTSNFCGTVGYIPPEYAATTRVSTKGDVYSYGVTLLEILIRKHPIIAPETLGHTWLETEAQQSGHLVDWVLQFPKENRQALLDPSLVSESTAASGSYDYQREQMKLVLQVALLCTQNDPQSRPGMSDVLAMLTQIKEIGLEPSNYRTVAELANEIVVWINQNPDAGHSVSF